MLVGNITNASDEAGAGMNKAGLALAGAALFTSAGCGVVSAVTGVEVEPFYSAEQKAAFRASYSMSMDNLTNGQFSSGITEADWAETYTSTANLCEALESHPRDEVRNELIAQLMGESTSGGTAMAGKFADAYILAATAQGSYCPGATS